METESVETTPAEAPEPAVEIRNDRDAIKAVETLLGAPSTAEPEKAQDDSEPAEMPGDLTSLAEKLKATPDKLYALKVPMADGESRTLGELKDGFRTADQLRVERDEVQIERTSLETERRQAFEELQAVARQIPNLSREAIEAVREQHSRRMQSELSLLLEAVPELKDPVRWAAERPVVEEWAKGFGFTPAELNEITDHKVLRALRYAALRDRDLKAERVKPPAKVAQAPRPARGPSPAMEHGRLKAAVTTRRMQPVNAVEQLLRGQ